MRVLTALLLTGLATLAVVYEEALLRFTQLNADPALLQQPQHLCRRAGSHPKTAANCHRVNGYHVETPQAGIPNLGLAESDLPRSMPTKNSPAAERRDDLLPVQTGAEH